MKHSDASLSLIPDERIANKVLLTRGLKVMLDRDLAELYGVETRRLSEQVTRNQIDFQRTLCFGSQKKRLGL